MREKGKVPEAKKQAALQLVEQFSRHKVIAVADLRKVRSSQLMEIRKKMRGKVDMLVTKNTLVGKAAEMVEEKRKNIGDFAEALSGPSLLLLTDMNPFELKSVLDRNKVQVHAKDGDIASSEIVVRAGNTGLSPGPVISEFSEAKVPTKIESGSIYISRDTVVARKGDRISAKVASVLSKLGMKPMEAGLSLVVAYDEGLVLRSDDLRFEISEYQANFQLAAKSAMWLSVEANYLTPESAPMILSKAQRQALMLSLESEYPAITAIPEILRSAFLKMKALSEQLGSKNKDAKPTSYEAPPAIIEAVKLKVTLPPIKPQPPKLKVEKPAVPEKKPVIKAEPATRPKEPAPSREPSVVTETVQPKVEVADLKEITPRPAIKEIKPEPAKERKPAAKPKIEIADVKKPTPEPAIEEIKPKPTKKQKPAAKAKQKAKPAESASAKKSKSTKEKAKRGKARSP